MTIHYELPLVWVRYNSYNVPELLVEGVILKAFALECNLEWPTHTTETEFLWRAKELPKGKTHGFLLPFIWTLPELTAASHRAILST